MSEEEIVYKELDLSTVDGEEVAEVSVEVPPEEGNGTYYKYTVKVPKSMMTEAYTDGSFVSFWKKIEEKVLEDVNSV